MEGNPEKVSELYRSVWRGRPPDIQDPSAFYALTLTGSQGRAIVRDWFESTVSVVADNLAAHFADLDIVRNTPKPRDRDLPPQIPLHVLLEAIAEPGENRRQNVPAPLVAHFVDAAVSGTMYPLAMMQRALLRFRAELRGEQNEAQGWSVKQWNDARAAVIKAMFDRRRCFYPDTTSYQEVQRDMDPSNSSSGYTLGRLMAVLERIQQEAMQNVNASVVDRYFSAASAAPKSVFVRLMKNTRHHVRKAQDDPDRGGTVFRLDRLVDELANQFDPKQNGFPSHLDLEQQGLFVLNYHQMRRWLWMPGEERERWEKAHPLAPRAYLWKTGKALGSDQ
jgi:CRISPR-associated protein Csd1